jgi:hypothetical protein
MYSEQKQFTHKKKHERYIVGGVVIPAWYMYLGYTGPANGYYGYYGGELTQARESNQSRSNDGASDASGISGDGSGLGMQ